MTLDSRQLPEPESGSHLAGLASKIREGKKSASQAEYDETPPKFSIMYRRTPKPKFIITSPISFIWFLIRTLARPIMCPPFKIELDGVIVARVAEGMKFETVTTAGKHRVRLLSTVSTATRDFDLSNGQRLRFWCQTSISGLVFQRED